MKSYIFTVGIHEDFAVRRLVSTNVGRDDVIVVLVKSPITGGNRRAINGLSAVMSKMGLRDAVVKEIEVKDIFHVVDQVSEILKEVKDPLIVDISGGESKTLAIGTILAVAVNKRVGRIYLEEDEEVSFQIEDFRTAAEGLSSELLKVLSTVVANPGIRHEVIAEMTGKKLKTTMNVVGILKKKRLVYQKGRGDGIYPTKLGILISKLNQENNRK
ncbi:CRISPR-associated transcriptional regulator Csa3 [Sulfurisphaera tokodaii]|uniref:CRISPR-associated transcriptional regulator Csa3 n=2 Tax=Sulfurisphaera tokodaii TaxID=111955 RepID=A0A832WX81_9CREN|nr:CRISPR-associated transcriptional regulator Csa3 [Sulfurisphaera tokodaii]BAK54837.1 probable CRISPR-associated protein Csa3 [Sulfurisphaera tokodaii str. 7]HII75276.1 CRISPR-associated transcriptional regulator Csa3 [Sulfurisphaera tokodaii]